MKKKELCKADLTKELSEKIWFFKIAEGGAMGEPGGITFITNDGTMYSFNYIYADTTYEDVIAFLNEYKLDTWVHNKTIQKACESYAIPKERKVYLKKFKIET